MCLLGCFSLSGLSSGLKLAKDFFSQTGSFDIERGEVLYQGEILSIIGVAERWLVGWQCSRIMYLV